MSLCFFICKNVYILTKFLFYFQELKAFSDPIHSTTYDQTIAPEMTGKPTTFSTRADQDITNIPAQSTIASRSGGMTPSMISPSPTMKTGPKEMEFRKNSQGKMFRFNFP